MVVVGESGTWFAKNSDRDPNEAQVLEWHPAASHPAGTQVACTYLTIPQAARTAAVLLSRPYWMWGAEMGLNAHGVAIGNEAVFTTQPLAKVGLTGMDLVRLGLERGDSAEAAVDVIVTLLERHGQGGGCGHEDRGFSYHNSFLVADAGEAWVVETAGKYVATERVTAGARTISNGLTIPGFAETHARRLHGWVAACAVRQARTTALAGAARGPADLAAALRDHGGTEPRYSLLNGAMSAPCMHAGGLAAASQTTGSLVVSLGRDGVRAWATGTSAPCTGLFKPVAVDRPVEVGAPTDVADDSLWWRHERLARRVMADPARLLGLYAAERDAAEVRYFAGEVPSEAAFAEGDALLAGWTERVAAAAGADRRPWNVRRYWGVRDRRAGL